MKNSSATHYARTRLTTTEVRDSLASLQHVAIVEDCDEVRADGDLMRFGNYKKRSCNPEPKAEVIAGCHKAGAWRSPITAQSFKILCARTDSRAGVVLS
jgi:hypothetical protein